METEGNVKGKTPAIVTYFTIFGSIIAIFLNLEEKHEFARFHTRQALALHLFLLLSLALISGFENVMIYSAFYLAYIVLWVYGFIGAIAGKKHEIPFLGPFAQQFFSKII